MIKLIIGGIGSGKSISVIKEISDNPDSLFYINFNCNLKNTIRLKIEHIITEEINAYKKDGSPIFKKVVNWTYWNKIKHTEFNIIIDEVHNILHSRRSMSTNNTLISMWLSQIRKILGDKKHLHLYLISQAINRIDVAARDLAGEVVYVESKFIKRKIKCVSNRNNKLRTIDSPVLYIIKYTFTGVNSVDKFNYFMMGSSGADYRSYFPANYYYRFYDSLELLDFGQEVYL